MNNKNLFKALTISVSAVMAFASAGVTNAVVLTFDDIPGGSIQNSYGAIGTYAGFNFASINGPDQYSPDRMDWIDTVNSSWYNFGAVSGDFTMLNNYGGSAVITEASGANFSFDGLWARIWVNDSELQRTGSIRGLKNGLEIWNSDVMLTDNWMAFNGHVDAIDELRLDFGKAFLVDDLALNQPSSVPVPSAAWLLGSGLLGLIGVARRKTA